MFNIYQIIMNLDMIKMKNGEHQIMEVNGEEEITIIQNMEYLLTQIL